MKTRAWLVDLDGTLYRAGWVKLAMAAELLLCGGSALATLRAFRAEHERLRLKLDTPVESPYALQLRAVADARGLEVATLEAVVGVWMIQRPGKWIRWFARRGFLAEIAAFRAQGGKVALVSDYPAREKLKALGARDLFDVLVANGEPGGPGRLKPWPDGYLHAAELLAVSPEDCLVIGDRADADGEAARRAGMRFRKVG